MILQPGPNLGTGVSLDRTFGLNWNAVDAGPHKDLARLVGDAVRRVPEKTTFSLRTGNYHGVLPQSL